MKHTLFVGAFLLWTASAFAQGIVSTHPPLSPEEAVTVLRGSQSAADWTGIQFGDGRARGPQVVVLRSSTAAGPYDWPAEAFAPVAPLSYEPCCYSVYVGNGRRHGGGFRSSQSVVTTPAPAAPRHINASGGTSGMAGARAKTR